MLLRPLFQVYPLWLVGFAMKLNGYRIAPTSPMRRPSWSCFSSLAARVRAFRLPGGLSLLPTRLTGAMIFAVSSTTWVASQIASPTGPSGSENSSYTAAGSISTRMGSVMHCLHGGLDLGGQLGDPGV